MFDSTQFQQAEELNPWKIWLKNETSFKRLFSNAETFLNYFSSFPPIRLGESAGREIGKCSIQVSLQNYGKSQVNFLFLLTVFDFYSNILITNTKSFRFFSNFYRFHLHISRWFENLGIGMVYGPFGEGPFGDKN